jgi:uroporphyrinogen-III synthase/uroporphyrinogen III methyltransferase/synthase
MLGEKNRNPVFDVPLVVVSDRIRHIAEDSGFKRIFVTDSPSDTAILTKITSWITGAESGRIE